MFHNFINTFVPMKKQHLTPDQAWTDFWKEYTANKPRLVPNELAVADATNRGAIKRNGVVKKLGPLRIARLLNKYAPGQYDFHEGSPYFTKPTKKK